MNKTLFISDLDGTLLGPDSRISPTSARIITDLTRQGALISVATARTPATVVPLMSATATIDRLIVMTGCAYWQRKANAFSSPNFVPAADVEAALNFCHSHGVEPFVYLMAPDGRSLDVYHAARRLNKAEESFYLERSRLQLKRFHLGAPAPARAATSAMLLYAMGDEERIRPAAESFAAATACSVCCYPDVFNPRVWNFEVFPPGISKAKAVERMRHDLDVDRLIVFGDSLNDLPMMAVADVAVAVGNALPQVKEAADVVIAPNYTDSVARFIATTLNSKLSSKF